MPATKKKSSKKVAQPQKLAPIKLPPWVPLGCAAITAAALGMSAPGIDQWYMAWFMVAPLFLLIASSNSVKQAMLRGLLFGTVYNLVYLNWFLQLHPLDWLKFSVVESVLVSFAAWTVVSIHQGLIFALFAGLVRWLPLAGGFLPRRVENKWKLPALLLLPILWVAMFNKIGNAPDLLGVPWTMIEYSQYKQLPIIQIASYIGGIGLGALIVMFNVSIAQLIATFTQRLSLKSLATSTQASAITSVLSVALVVVSLYAFGLSKLNAAETAPTQTLSVVQGNINIEMQKSKHRYTLEELLIHYAKLLDKCPAGIVVWTESALPTYLRSESASVRLLASLSARRNLDMVIGSLDRDFDGNPYNSAFGLGMDGKLLANVYHKRYLVPFGEYMPAVVKNMPEWMQRLTNTPAGGGFNAGKLPVVLSVSGKQIAPLICFETMSPELVVSSVRSGGELLVNLSDLAWFHKSMCGDQMTAFSVMRAVENGRYFVFAANTGPSSIIDNRGNIRAISQQDKEMILTGKVSFERVYTPFTQWFN